MSAEALVRRAFSAFNEGDPEGLIATVHPEIVFVPLLTGAGAAPYKGHAGMRRYLADARGWSSGQVLIGDVNDQGDVAIATARIVVQSEQGAMEIDAVYVARVRDGLICDLVTLADASAARGRLGVQPAQAAAHLHLQLDAEAASVPIARHAARAYARAAGCTDTEAIELSISEAVTNVVLHAYVGLPEAGHLVLSGRPAGDDLLFSVQDVGRGLLPRPDSPGLGMGLGLMQHHAAEVSFIGPPQRLRGTEVRLRFAR